MPLFPLMPIPAPAALVAGLVGLLSASSLQPAMAAGRDAQHLICETAARRAARDSGVPEAVLLAISIAETGRRTGGTARPWPWAMNLGGEGHWFATADDLRAAAAAALAEGRRNLDLGCFQLNHRWHAEGFVSLDQMIDPEENARYAARFLARLHGETGDWARAAAAYHSRTPEHGQKYQARFETILAGLNAPAVAAASGRSTGSGPEIRQNRYPLLQRGTTGGAGSIVPRLSAGRSLFGGS